MIATMSLHPSEDEAAPPATSRPGAFHRRRPTRLRHLLDGWGNLALQEPSDPTTSRSFIQTPPEVAPMRGCTIHIGFVRCLDEAARGRWITRFLEGEISNDLAQLHPDT